MTTTQAKIKEIMIDFLKNHGRDSIKELTIDLDETVNFLNEIVSEQGFITSYSIDVLNEEYSLYCGYYDNTINKTIIVKYDCGWYERNIGYFVDLLLNNEQQANELKKRLLSLKD